VIVEDVVKRHEFARPELRLVGYEEVALPFYRVRIHAFMLEDRPTAVFDECVLKCLHSGLVAPSDLAEFPSVSGIRMSNLLREAQSWIKKPTWL
jgi:hypothetical protein